MRVLHLTTEFPPVIYRGLGTAVGGWVNASARAGLEIAVQLVEGSLLIEGGMQRYGLPQHWPATKAPVRRQDGVVFFRSSWEGARDVGVRLVRDWQAEIVHLHTAMLWYLADAIQRATGKPIVYHIHSVDRAEYELGQEPNPWLAHSEAQERAIHRADCLVALTASEARLLAHYYPLARHKIRVAGNGIDDCASARQAAFQKPCHANPIILYSGRLVERKGVRELLAALPGVLQAYPACLAVFVGGPPPLTGREVAGQWLGEEHAPFEQRIRFTGWQPPEEVSSWYQSADILVVPSRYEPFGMVILEGMLYGLTVLASNVGGPAEIIEHGRTGILFGARDVGALSAELRWLLSHPRERREIGRSAAVQVRERWLWDAKVTRMLAIYKELIYARETRQLSG